MNGRRIEEMNGNGGEWGMGNGEMNGKVDHRLDSQRPAPKHPTQATVWDDCLFPPPLMAQDLPPSDSDSDGFEDAEEYQYESEGEERLATSARNLMNEAEGNYRCECFLNPETHLQNLKKASSRTSCGPSIHKVTEPLFLVFLVLRLTPGFQDPIFSSSRRLAKERGPSGRYHRLAHPHPPARVPRLALLCRHPKPRPALTVSLSTGD